MRETKSKFFVFIILGFILISSSTVFPKALNQGNLEKAIFISDKNNYWNLNSPRHGFVVCKNGYIAGPATADPVKIQAQKELCRLSQKKYAISNLPIFNKTLNTSLNQSKQNKQNSYPAYQVNFGQVKFNLCKGFLSMTNQCFLEDEAIALAYINSIQEKILEKEKQKFQAEKSLLLVAIDEEKSNLIQELKQELKKEVKKELLSEIYSNEELNKTRNKQAKEKTKFRKILQERLAFLSSKDLQRETRTNSLFEFKEKQNPKDQKIDQRINQSSYSYYPYQVPQKTNYQYKNYYSNQYQNSYQQPQYFYQGPRF